MSDIVEKGIRDSFPMSLVKARSQGTHQAPRPYKICYKIINSITKYVKCDSKQCVSRLRSSFFNN